MKVVLILLSFMTLQNYVFAMGVEEVWSSEYRPQLKLSCTEGEESMCSDLCPGSSSAKECILDQKVCRDCVGTSLLVTNIFEGMGVRYRNRGDEVSFYEFVDLIASKNFVSFTSKSVYNHVDSYDSLVLQKKFQSLCPVNSTLMPVVFFDLKPRTNVLNKVRYVACGEKLYTMSDDALVDIGVELKSFKIRFY